MKTLELFESLRNGGSVLCLGAHSDDIEIGCGGTLQKLLAESKNLTVHWVVLSAAGVREEEARASATDYLNAASQSKLTIMNFRNGFFPYHGAEIKEFFETLKALPRPDLILTHYNGDLHQDHRCAAELTWNTFRDHLILEYEIPKYDGDLGSPNLFVPLDESHVRLKTVGLNRHFRSQHDKQWFSATTFEGLGRLRGVQCNSPTGLAEAFYCRKAVIG
jgi:LmbE family N-acetylglucosaminyl deacetylase